MIECLTDDTVAAYVDGALALDEVGRVDHHIDECAECRDQLSTVAASPHSFTSEIAGSTPGLAELVLSTIASGRAGDPLPKTKLGRYVIEEVIGRGGMGVVVRARDPELDRFIAIKLVDPARKHGAWRVHVREEARAMAKLRHPNVVAVYDAGSIGDQLFIAMELVEGSSLTRLRGLDRRAVLAACLDAGRGLCAAHAVGVIHGDIKPDNILVGSDGRALVGDFGLARAIADDATRGIAGTPGYMAPELARGEPVTVASDQYAFAVTVYEALVGERPGASRLPRRIGRVIERGLAPRAADRYATMADFVAALERATKRRWVVPAIVLAAAGIALGAFPHHAPSCADAGDRAAAITPACSGAACAELGRRATAWANTSVAVCNAGGHAGDPRRRCLEERWVEHGELATQVVGKPDDPNAILAVSRLARPETCLTATTATFAPRIDQLPLWLAARRWVAHAKATDGLGHFRAALEELAPKFAAIQAIGDPELTADAALVLADLEITSGQLVPAEATLDIGLRAAATANDDVANAKVLLRLAQLIGESRQQWDRGGELLRAADAAVVRAGNPPELVGTLALARGMLAEERGDLDEATSDYTRAIELRRGGRPDDYANALEIRCSLETHTDHLEEASKDCEQALEIVRDALGPDHPLVAEAEINLGTVSAVAHDSVVAKRIWTTALARLDRAGGDDRLGLATILLDLGEVSLDTGDMASAKSYLDRLRTVSASAETSPQYLDVQIQMAHLLRETEGADAEIKAMEDIERRAEATLGLVSRTTAHSLEDLAVAYYQAGRMPEARATFERAVTSARGLYGLRHRTTLGIEGRYAQSLLELGDAKTAKPLLEQIVAIVDVDLPPDSTFRAEAYTNLADCLLQLGDISRSIELAHAGLAIREQRGDDPLQMSEVRFIYAKALWRNHDPAAIAVATKSRDEMKAIGKRATTLPEVEAFLKQARAR